MRPFRTEQLANGVAVEFRDRSNRYFGDYHRVCVEVLLTVSVGGAGSLEGGEGKVLQKVKQLERMGVPGAEVEVVRSRLVDDFWRHAARYLAHPDYPARLAVALDRAPHGRPTPLPKRC